MATVAKVTSWKNGYGFLWTNDPGGKRCRVFVHASTVVVLTDGHKMRPARGADLTGLKISVDEVDWEARKGPRVVSARSLEVVKFEAEAEEKNQALIERGREGGKRSTAAWMAKKLAFEKEAGLSRRQTLSFVMECVKYVLQKVSERLLREVTEAHNAIARIYNGDDSGGLTEQERTTLFRSLSFLADDTHEQRVDMFGANAAQRALCIALGEGGHILPLIGECGDTASYSHEEERGAVTARLKTRFQSAAEWDNLPNSMPLLELPVAHYRPGSGLEEWERKLQTEAADQEQADREEKNPPLTLFEKVPGRLDAAREAISKAERILEGFSGPRREEAARVLRGAEKRIKYAECPESTFSKRGKSPSEWKLAGAALRFAEEVIRLSAKAAGTEERQQPIRAIVLSTYDWCRGRVTAEILRGRRTTVTIPLTSLGQVPFPEKEALYMRVVEILELDFNGDPDKGFARVVSAKLTDEVQKR